MMLNVQIDLLSLKSKSSSLKVNSPYDEKFVNLRDMIKEKKSNNTNERNGKTMVNVKMVNLRGLCCNSKFVQWSNGC